MGYTSVTVLNYNASPPSDDGSTESTNQITWAGIKTKLADPLKTAIESINTEADTAVATLDVAMAALDSEVTSTLAAFDAEISSAVFDTGTAMLFKQTAAPTGWTKLTDSATYNDKALRLVTGTAATGGSTAFTSVFAARTILQANLPSVNLTHNFSVETDIDNGGNVWRNGSVNSFREGTGSTQNIMINASSSTLSLTDGTVNGTVALGGSGTAMDFAVAYVDVIVATKNAP